MNTQIELLKTSSWDTPKYTFAGKKIIAKCVKVYDGDSITACFCPTNEEEGSIYKFSVRLAGIDTPELRSHDEKEKKAAYEARDFLSKKILNKLIVLKCADFDKYGRILADVFSYDESEHFNNLMITHKFAYPYGGGKKQPFQQTLLNDDEVENLHVIQ